jgi:predicted AAA+ superfamily ATPase
LINSPEGFPVLTVTGPRQSGKSTLCRMAFPSKPYANLESPDIRREATEDSRGFLARYPEGAVLDEIQRVSELTSYLQPLVDADPTPGRWVLTGSQHGLLRDTVSQSLAGRNVPIELLPLSFDEARAFPRGDDGRAVHFVVVHAGDRQATTDGVSFVPWNGIAAAMRRVVRV